MNQFQALLARLAAQQQKDASAESPDSAQQQNGEPATVKLAERISERLLGHPLSDDAKQLADPIVHYTYGAVWGGIYCAMAEIMPETAKTAGLVFGGGLWLAGDEVAVHLPWGYRKARRSILSARTRRHWRHLVYGVIADVVRRTVRRALALSHVLGEGASLPRSGKS